jgi:hypothetical protein
VLTATGQGHYVGTNLILPAVSWTLEGDEHIFVDGMRSPSIAGTGTEDYVNGGWYFSYGPFSAAFSGLPERAAPAHPISAYRLHITDSIPFRTSIRVALEHDGINSNQVPYASVAYYYLKAEPGMIETDSFEPADPESAASHSFEVEGATDCDAPLARFFSDVSTTGEVHNGVAAKIASQFSVAIDCDNAGVVLRRSFDQATADQRVDVYVEGQLAGAWYAAGGSSVFRWREDEFWIPSELTRGRSRLNVRLVVRGPTWNAYEYRAFSLMPAPMLSSQ